MMRSRFALAVVILGLVGCSPTTDVPLGTASAARFHEQLNAGQFETIYAASAPAFKAVTTEASLLPILAAVHRKLGLFKAGAMQGWNDNINTGGHILSFTMQSQYEKGPATESFSFAISDGKATLVSYNINSTLLITS